MQNFVRQRFGKRVQLSLINYSSRSLYTTNALLRGALKVLAAPVALLRTQGAVIPNIEMDVTSRCTLNCRECSHLIPTHRSAHQFHDYDVAELLGNIDLLLPMIDRCLRFRLLGGEPLMHKELHLVIRRLVGEKKIKHIQIATNGTIIPTGENLAALQHPKVSVNISNYGDLAPQKAELVRTLRAAGVHTLLLPYEPRWRAIGDFAPRGYTREQMRTIFLRCNMLDCKSLHDGRLWMCPRAFHGAALGVMPENPAEYIDLRTVTREQFWEQLDLLYEDPAGVTTCYRCTGGDLSSAPEVPCAEQAPVGGE